MGDDYHPNLDGPAEPIGLAMDPAASASYPIVVKIEPGLDLHPIEHIQLIEKQLDVALLPCGYIRSTSSKSGDEVVFSYRQCAIMEEV